MRCIRGYVRAVYVCVKEKKKRWVVLESDQEREKGEQTFKTTKKCKKKKILSTHPSAI